MSSTNSPGCKRPTIIRKGFARWRNDAQASLLDDKRDRRTCSTSDHTTSRHRTFCEISLASHLELERRAQEAGDRQKIIALSGEFHYLVADMAGNSFLSRTLRELETLTALIITLFGTANHETCPSDHPALVDAIEQRDPQRAAELMLHHLAHVESSIQLNSVERPPATLEEVLA